MPKRRRRKAKDVPRFPRKRWTEGQAPRVETPEKGKGAYRRRGESEEKAEAADEALEDRRGGADTSRGS